MELLIVFSVVSRCLGHIFLYKKIVEVRCRVVLCLCYNALYQPLSSMHTQCDINDLYVFKEKKVRENVFFFLFLKSEGLKVCRLERIWVEKSKDECFVLCRDTNQYSCMYIHMQDTQEQEPYYKQANIYLHINNNLKSYSSSTRYV